MHTRLKIPTQLFLSALHSDLFSSNLVWWLFKVRNLFKNNRKNNFELICCKFPVNLCKSSEILKQYDVKWWLNYRIYRFVSYSFSCTFRKSTFLKISLLVYFLIFRLLLGVDNSPAKPYCVLQMFLPKHFFSLT